MIRSDDVETGRRRSPPTSSCAPTMRSGARAVMAVHRDLIRRRSHRRVHRCRRGAHLAAVLIKRRDAIAALSAGESIRFLSPRLDADGRLSFRECRPVSPASPRRRRVCAAWARSTTRTARRRGLVKRRARRRRSRRRAAAARDGAFVESNQRRRHRASALAAPVRSTSEGRADG